MRISFHKQGIELDDSQREHIELRLQFALGRFSPRITHVAVHVADTNGRRGGIDKRCRLVTRVTGLDELVVEDHDQNFNVLIDRVTERLGHTVGRRFERERFGKERVAFDGRSPRVRDKPDA